MELVEKEGRQQEKRRSREEMREGKKPSSGETGEKKIKKRRGNSNEKLYAHL